MKDLSSAVVTQTHKQQASTPWVWLITVWVEQSATQLQPFRCTTHDADITWDGNTYRPFPVKMAQIGADASGNLETTRLQLANITRAINRYAETNRGSTGNEVWLTGLSASTLNPADGRTYKLSIITTSLDHQWVTLDLGQPQFFRRQVPAEIHTRGRCANTYKGPVCKYRGSLGTCDKTLADCIAHGDDEVANSLPRMHPRQFRAFPAISRRSS